MHYITALPLPCNCMHTFVSPSIASSLIIAVYILYVYSFYVFYQTLYGILTLLNSSPTHKSIPAASELIFLSRVRNLGDDALDKVDR